MMRAMMTCQIVTDPETALGFRLAGSEAFAAADGREAEEIIAGIVQKKECGLLLVREDLLAGVGATLLRRIERSGFPIIVPLPLQGSWFEEERGLEYVLRLIRRSIGYQMRIRR